MIFDDSRVQTRGGTLKLNTAAVASYACDGLYTRHDSSGAESMVAWFGGTLWALSGTSFNTVASAQSIDKRPVVGIRSLRKKGHIRADDGVIWSSRYRWPREIKIENLVEKSC